MDLEYNNGVAVPKLSPELRSLREHKKRIKLLEDRVTLLEEQIKKLLRKGDN